MREKLAKILNSKTFLQVLVAVILIGIFFSFVYQISLLKSQGNFTTLPRGSIPQTMPANVSSIQSWMTLNYIAKIYHIPPTYFEQALNVPAGKYRHLSIYNYAKMAKITPPEAIVKIQNAVRDYQQRQESPQS